LFSIFGPQRALDHAAFLSVEVAQTPLPAALPLFASVLGGAGFAAWRRKRKAAAAIAT
jgi:hypothetical protein